MRMMALALPCGLLLLSACGAGEGEAADEPRPETEEARAAGEDATDPEPPAEDAPRTEPTLEEIDEALAELNETLRGCLRVSRPALLLGLRFRGEDGALVHVQPYAAHGRERRCIQRAVAEVTVEPFDDVVYHGARPIFFEE